MLNRKAQIYLEGGPALRQTTQALLHELGHRFDAAGVW
jgi:hypothetical protein